MEVATTQERVTGPFVSTPAGEGVVEVDAERDLYVRFGDGRRDWFDADDCEHVNAPAGYEPPGALAVPGYLR